MAATLHPLRNVVASGLYSQSLDIQDNRYPSPQTKGAHLFLAPSPRSGWDNSANSDTVVRPHSSGVQDKASAWMSELHHEAKSPGPTFGQDGGAPPPAGLEGNCLDRPSSPSGVAGITAVGSEHEDQVPFASGTPLLSSPSPEHVFPLVPSTPRHPAAPTSAGPPNSGQQTPVMPPLASPTLTPPVSGKHRAYAQQPTYITTPYSPKTTTYTSMPQPQEDVCLECAMRDQDMFDVDVTSPGVWERASDVLYEELKAREEEEEASAVHAIDDRPRPRATGGRLSEQNIKLWLSINPREPASKQQTLSKYIQSQRTMLEAESAARDKARQEAKELDTKMRDAYSQLRRSAYDSGTSASQSDEFGGVRIKTPKSPSAATFGSIHTRSQSREVTLLENGMIVEHIDIRKEEREIRERRRKEKRVRKWSRSSIMDASIISAQSYGPHEYGLKPQTLYSQASSARPTSVLTAPLERPDLPRAYSQASFSDVHSLGSTSPRRTRFFGSRNLSAGWMSQDSLSPSGMSGSMVDMHVALQRESAARYTTSPVDNMPRLSPIRLSKELQQIPLKLLDDKSGKKKKNGLAKIWRIVTGSTKQGKVNGDPSMANERTDDDVPLAPPPPLSYLVARGPSNIHSPSGRHVSSPSFPPSNAHKHGVFCHGVSPSTTPTSNLSSSTSSRFFEIGLEVDETRNFKRFQPDEQDRPNLVQEGPPGTPLRKPVHPAVTSESEMRLSFPSFPQPSSPLPPLPASSTLLKPLVREKSLPPLPPAHATDEFLDNRPRTMYSYAKLPGTAPAYELLPPQAPFRSVDHRRQSFGGVSTKPNISVQTAMTGKSGQANGNLQSSLGQRYDELGLSRRSLIPLDPATERPRVWSHAPSTTKRKSKFGLSSLLGKKTNSRDTPVESAQRYPMLRNSGMDGKDDYATQQGYAARTRINTVGAPNVPMRMSIASRKTLEDLVKQDAEFIAYRYPSNDQHFDLRR